MKQAEADIPKRPAAAAPRHVTFANLEAALWRRIGATVLEWQRRARERTRLRRMTERDLRDIGLSRVDALREATKPFWRA